MSLDTVLALLPSEIVTAGSTLIETGAFLSRKRDETRLFWEGRK